MGLEDRAAARLGGVFPGKAGAITYCCLFFASEPPVSHCGVAVCSLPSLCWLPWGWKRPLLCVWRRPKTWLLKSFPVKTEESRLTKATIPCLQRLLPYGQHGSIPHAPSAHTHQGLSYDSPSPYSTWPLILHSCMVSSSDPYSTRFSHRCLHGLYPAFNTISLPSSSTWPPPWT